MQSCAGFEYIAKVGDTMSSIAAGVCQAPLNTVTAANPQVADFTKICDGDSICCPGKKFSNKNCMHVK